MKDFKICYPDANNFDKVIKIKNVNDWNVEYIKLNDSIGYWIAEDPFVDNGFELFKNLISCFPIQKDNNHDSNFDPNPFDTIHVPEWVSNRLCMLVRDFYHKNVRTDWFDPQIHEWGNVYFKNRSRPISCWRIPHIDYVHGIVANMWFTDHPLNESGTKLYQYKGKMYNEIYDFQIDETHIMHKEWREMSENPVRSDSWFNFSDDELLRWGFDLVGIVPNQVNTVTMYKSNVCHLAYISDKVDFRWSHAFAFSHELIPHTMRDLFR